MQESLNVLSEIFDDKEQMWSQRALSAWQTLKAAVLAQQTANTGIHEIAAQMEQSAKYERDRGFHTVECCDVERWAHQLRAGA